MKGFENERQRIIATLLEIASEKELPKNIDSVQQDLCDCLAIGTFAPATSKFEKYALPYVEEFSYLAENKSKTALLFKTNKKKFRELLSKLAKYGIEDTASTIILKTIVF